MTSDSVSDSAKRAVSQWWVEHGSRARDLAADLHAHPETAWQERYAHERLTGLLRTEGFAIDDAPADLPTAFVARRAGGRRHVAFVAEYDALPGLGHACGHHLIAAMSYAAAAMLSHAVESHPELDLTVSVIGSPAEEGGGGKIALLDAGIFDGLDAAMMVHPGPANVARAEPFAVAHWQVTYVGRGAHAAAYPHLGVNAADAMTIAQVAIGLLRQQLPETVRVHGIVTEAGTAPNAIAERCVGRWYVRASSLAELDEVEARVRACFEAGALATGCTLGIEPESPRYADFINDEPLLAAFVANMAALGRDFSAPVAAEVGAMNRASTDMGNVSHRVRAIHPYIDIDSLPAVNHQAAFAAAGVGPGADAALADGARALALTAIDLVSSLASDDTIEPH